VPDGCALLQGGVKKWRLWSNLQIDVIDVTFYSLFSLSSFIALEALIDVSL
jgi:hypothetical protein